MEDFRSFRKSRNLTLEAVGLLAGRDPATISRIERGLVDAEPETVVKVSQALGISVKRTRALLAESRRRQVHRGAVPPAATPQVA